MASYLENKVAFVIGSGGEAHRGVAVALGQAGADIAIGGSVGDLAAEAALHSIANEVWAIGRRSTVVTLADDSSIAFAAAVSQVMAEMGKADLVVRCEAVAHA